MNPPTKQNRNDTGFDYFVLVLSWAPSFCNSHPDQDDTRECSDTNRPYSFIVHGLWPEYQKGWPQFCDTDTQPVPEHIVNAMIDIMPSEQLIQHEWLKHGTCSNLDQQTYFNTIRTLFSHIRIPQRYVSLENPITISPEQLKQDFMDVNPLLNESMIYVKCKSRSTRKNLKSVKICFNKSGVPRACGQNETSCKADCITMPAVR